MVEKYLKKSSQLKQVFLLIDIRHDPSANDKMMYHWIVEQGYQPIIIATKLDKIKRSQVQKCIKILKEGLELVPGTKVIPFSSQTKQGRDEIWDLIETEYLNQSEEAFAWKTDAHTGRSQSAFYSVSLPRQRLL